MRSSHGPCRRAVPTSRHRSSTWDATTRCSTRASSPGHDAQTGREVYGRQRIDPASGNFTTSPWAYNGRIFCLSEDGVTFVIDAGSQFKVLGRNEIGDFCMASPAIARGSLILRTFSCLYRIARSAPPLSNQ